ncbi:MAG TPA: hypothetical protein VFW30_08400 [Bryocella sp.]|nr:hypothetical protein [Bryocella sp.]
MYPDQYVRVKGFPWCRDAAKEVRIETLTQPILCEKHNNQLGNEVDWAAKHSLEAISQAVELMNRRQLVRSRHWNIKHFETDMLLLERWCIKALINMNHQGRMKYVDDSEPENPPHELVELVFGRRRITDHKGLYIIANVGVTHTVTEGQLQTTVMSKDERLVGAHFMLWGIPFYLNLLPTQVTRDNLSLVLPTNNVSFMRQGMKQVFSTRDDKNRDVKSHVLTFTYPE